MAEMPSQEILDNIRAQGYSGSLYSKTLGDYKISVIYRESSAITESPRWYPETMIMQGRWAKGPDGYMNQWPRIRYQGEGWDDYIRIVDELQTIEQVEEFLRKENPE